MRDDDDPDIGDEDIRRTAAKFILRRLAIWTVPLLLVGMLLVGLGLPIWLTVVALVIGLAVVVFELDL